MKRLLLILLFIPPGLSFGAFTEFYMQSGGSNLNAGSTNNNTAAYTSTNGNWNGSTIFTPTDGSTPASTVAVGDFASVYLDGASVGVFIARVTAVAAGVNGAITVSAGVKYGTAPASGATGRTIKVGGAWLGPNGASNFPFGLTGTLATLVNTSSDQTRINAKNDQTYTMTAQLAFAALGRGVLQGYSSTVGDLGKATFTSNITTAANFTAGTNACQTYIDLIFVSTGTSNANACFESSATGNVMIRCVFHGGRDAGLRQSGGQLTVFESEAYDCNLSNTANRGGFTNVGGGIMICINCYSHDHAAGSNADGFTDVAAGMVLINCIADSVAGSGLRISHGNVGLPFISINSDYYNNTGDAIKLAHTGGFLAYPLIVNNNFTKNGGKGVNNTVTSQGGIMYNNGRGSGTQANGSSDTLQSIVNTSTDVTYPNNATPYFAPTTGNFSIALQAAYGAGRGNFTETDGTNSGTVAYPDIGAGQHDDTCSGLGPCQTSGASAH